MTDLTYGACVKEFQSLRYLVPDPKEVEERYREYGGAFPYWTRVWEAGFSMANWLLVDPALVEGKTVVEMGAGIGRPSFIAARKACRVFLSDHDAAAVAWAEMNISSLGLSNVDALLLSWKQNKILPADVVLMSDIGYDPSDFSYLELLIRQYLENESEILVTVPARITSANFVETLRPWIHSSESNEVNGREVLRLVLKK
jgi:predicted nicotinamide N-methyase